MAGPTGCRASPVDVHVGSRIRLRRIELGMSQERLGSAVGLTFQQIQKYERGVNRVGASRLFDLSRVLDVPVGYFYDQTPDGAADRAGEHQPYPPDGPAAQRETLKLVRAYYRIADPAKRAKLLELLRFMGPQEE